MTDKKSNQPLLTDSMILHHWDAYVGEPDAKHPLTDTDKIAFARIIETEVSKLRAPVAGEAQKPVAWFIDWPEDPELGHYLAESPAETGRCRPLVFADAASQTSEPVYAYRRKGLDDFVTCDRERFDELSAKPRLFETRIFYAAPQASEAVRDAKAEGFQAGLDQALEVLEHDDFATRMQSAQVIRALKTQSAALSAQPSGNPGELAAQPGAQKGCNCAACRPHSVEMRMILCETCGDKRCPHAADHRNDCVGTGAQRTGGSDAG